MNWRSFERLVKSVVPETYAVAGDFYGWVGGVVPEHVERVAVTVDVFRDYDFSRFDVVVAHHFPPFTPDFPVFVVHTPLDRIEWGCNYALGRVLGIDNLSFFDDNRFGMYGEVDLSPDEFPGKVAETLDLKRFVFYMPDTLERIRKVAVFSGCGFNFSGFIDNLVKFGVDVAISGDLVHHTACKLRALGIGFIDASHYRTEIPGMVEFTHRLKEFVYAEFIDAGFPYSDFCLC
ncbi:Nif3-like dinuclear metal center hexameric protein [Desulfurobacterium sp.]